MSREQGPREAGMRPAANVAGRRQGGAMSLPGLTEATHMSREQGPREAGMRPAANVAGRWHHGPQDAVLLSEMAS